jgi:hypothetical protein
VRRRRATQALCVAALGLASWLAPAGAALGATGATSGTSHPTATHHPAPKKPVVSHGVLCRDIKAQQASRAHLGQGLASALRSGHVDRAKQGMLRVLGADLKKEDTAQHALRASPAKIRGAEHRLVADVEHVKESVLHASKVTQLLDAFDSLGHGTHMATDGVTLANWYQGQCEAPHAPSAHPSTPTAPSTPNSTIASGGTP